MSDVFGLPTEPVNLKRAMDTSAADFFFEGLKMELPHAVASGKMADWSKCADSILRLLESDYQRRFPTPPDTGERV